MREDWVIAKLSECCEILDNLRSPINAKERAQRIEGKNENNLYPYYGATGQVGYIDGYLTDGEFVLVGEDGAPFLDFSKPTAYMIKGKTWVNNHAHILKSLFDNKYLLHYLNQVNYKQFVSGTTRLKLTQGALKNIPFKLAPILEQKAMVAKIEQLFSELDNGIEDLKTAQAKLKIYRQAVLQKAFEGEFTREWREKQTNLPTADKLLETIKQEREAYYLQQLEEWKQAIKEWEKNGGDGKKPSRTSKPKTLSAVTGEETESYGNLPTCWKWERFSNVTHKIGDIDHKMPKEFEGGLPYLSTGNLKKDGTIDFQNAKTISRTDFNRLALKIKPERNDIIFPRYGTIGRNILVHTDQDFLVSYACAIIKNINNLMDCKFVYYYSLSPVIKKEIKRYVVQTTQANIGIASIENFVFPLCSLQEQNQIVQEIESRLSVCDKIEETIKQSLLKSEALRQSILKKAFEGKLLNTQEVDAVKNHPDYESAENLLKRIKQERAK